MTPPTEPLVTVDAEEFARDGNTLALLQVCKRALVRKGYRSEGDELVKRVFRSGSQEEAIQIMFEYVELEDEDG